MEFVSWDDYSQYMEKSVTLVPNHQPDNYITIDVFPSYKLPFIRNFPWPCSKPVYQPEYPHDYGFPPEACLLTHVGLHLLCGLSELRRSFDETFLKTHLGFMSFIGFIFHRCMVNGRSTIFVDHRLYHR